MKKQTSKQAKKASKLAKAENLKKKQAQVIIVKNAEGDPDTTAEILIQNQINYTPKVSVIIPVYNVEQYLRQCLDSVVNQTLKEIEIICVDDGSTDSSLEILKEYAAKDKRMTVIRQQNLHAGVARNAGLSQAKGEYLSFLDSDDFFELNMLEEMFVESKKYRTDIIICDADKFNTLNNQYMKLDAIKTRLVKEKEVFCLDDIKDKVYYITQPATWNKLYKTKFIFNFPIRFQSLKSCNDFGFSYTILSLARKIRIIPKIFIHYRKFTASSITSNRNKSAYNIILAYQYVKNNLIKYNKVGLTSELNKRLISAIKYESSLCTREEKLKLKEKAKEILKEEYDIFSKYFVRDVVPVVVASDDNYSKPLGVCLYSILEKTSAFIDFIILSDGITEKNIKKIKSSIKKFKNYKISFVDMKRFNLSQFPKIDRFERSAFSRYFIPEICQEYDKVIYTDPDVIFNGDIADYYDINMNEKGIAAASEELGAIRGGKYNHEQRKKLFGISSSHKYFANGNLIISCDYWRKNHIIEKLIAKTDELRDKLVCPDLDVMNVIFQNNYKQLHFKYCTTVHRYTAISGNQEMIEGYKNPFIIHYSGGKKPWDTKDVLFYKEWNEIYKKTAFYSPKSKLTTYLFFPYYFFSVLLLRKKKEQLLREKDKNKTVKTVKIIKQVSSVKLFNLIPIATFKQRGGKKVWKILGLPVWKKRTSDNKNIKYYLFGLPILRLNKKSAEVVVNK